MRSRTGRTCRAECPGMKPPTANDAAALHEAADAHDCTWAVDTLPAPYLVHHETRTVWIDGRLHLDDSYHAIAAGLTELGALPYRDGTVIPFPTARQHVDAG